jgi:hypothetical protein
MPSLRAHLVFMGKLREALERDLPAVGAAAKAHWPSALLGSEAPDSWYFTEQQRPDTHALDMQDASTWPGAVERWLDSHPELAPGREQPPETVAFVAGYLSHIGLDTWEQCFHPDFPAAARAEMPPSWFPPEVADAGRRRAALQALGEVVVPGEYLVDTAALEHAPIPAGFRADAIRTITTGIAPALPLSDPWAMSRVNPLPGRTQPDTPEARRAWEAGRTAAPPATDRELAALLDGALAFTLAMVRRWW